MKSYREFLLEQKLGKEVAQNLPMPIGGFYVQPRINKVLGLREADEQKAYQVLPIPVIFDRYDIAYLSQIPPFFWGEAMEKRYSDWLFDAKEKGDPGGMRKLEVSHQTGAKSQRFVFEVEPFMDHLLKKMETPFDPNHLKGIIDSPEDKKTLISRIHGDNIDQNNPYDFPGRFAPEYAVHGFDLSKVGEYEDPKSRSKTILARNYIAPDRKLLRKAISNWLKSISDGTLMGNPRYYDSLISDPEQGGYLVDNFRMANVGRRGGTEAEFYVDIFGNAHRNSTQFLSYDKGGFDHLATLLESTGLSDLPFAKSSGGPSGQVSYRAFDEAGRPIDPGTSGILTTFVPVLLEGGLLSAQDYRKIYGTVEQQQYIKAIVNGEKPVDKKGNPVDLGPNAPLNLRMAALYAKYGNSAQDTDEWQEIIEERTQVISEIDEWDAHDFLTWQLNPAKIPLVPDEGEEDEEGTPGRDYWRKVGMGGRVKNPVDDVIQRGTVDIMKNQSWCIPTNDKECRKIARHFATGELGSVNSKDDQGNVSRKSLVDSAFERIIDKLKKRDAGYMVNAVIKYHQTLTDLIYERLISCFSGHPLVVLYKELANGEVDWQDAHWRNRWEDVDIGFRKDFSEFESAEELLKELEWQIRAFLRDKSQTVIDNALQLDIDGMGTRRQREKSGVTGGQDMRDIGDVVDASTKGMQSMQQAAYQRLNQTIGGSARPKGMRTAIREVRPETIWFAHNLSTMIGVYGQAKQHSEKAKVSFEQALQAVQNGEPVDVTDTIESVADAMSADVSAMIAQQIMKNGKVDLKAAEEAAFQKAAEESNTNPADYVHSKEAESEKAEKDINEMLSDLSQEEKAIITMAIDGHVDTDVVRNQLDKMEAEIQDALAQNDPDAIEQKAKIDVMRKMMGFAGLEPEQQQAPANQQKSTTSAMPADPQMLQMFNQDPQRFLTQVLPQGMSSQKEFGASVMSALATANNPNITKQFAAHFAQNPKVWQQVMQSSGMGDPKIQRFIQKDPNFQQLLPKTEGAIGAGTDAIFDRRKKSRDWNWMGTPGSTGVSPKEGPIKSWLKKKEQK